MNKEFWRETKWMWIVFGVIGIGLFVVSLITSCSANGGSNFPVEPEKESKTSIELLYDEDGNVVGHQGTLSWEEWYRRHPESDSSRMGNDLSF